MPRQDEKSRAINPTFVIIAEVSMRNISTRLDHI